MIKVLIHWSEISLKGKNKSFFEHKLKERILEVCHDVRITKLPSALLVISFGQHDEIRENLRRVFGISHFLFAREIKAGFKNTEGALKRIAQEAIDLLKEKEFKSFCVATKRSDKTFGRTSPKVNEYVGEAIQKAINTRVQLKNPEISLCIEMVAKRIFVSTERCGGPGGLPTGTSGSLFALLSGGIDSPVAAWKMMRRGASCDFIHFHSYPQTDKASIEKAKDLARELAKWQGHSKLFLAPFLPIQKEFFFKCEKKYLVLLYRRVMMKMAQEFALKNKALGLVTGESLGQVASQTLENMAAVSEVCELPIYRPLIGNDKEEIIKTAKDIGTYDISILPHEDCCSLFVPKHPEIRASAEELVEEEKKIDLLGLIEAALNNTEEIII